MGRLLRAYSLGELEAAIRELGESPRWTEFPRTQHQHHSVRFGAVLNTWTSTGTVHVQGGGAARFKEALGRVLGELPEIAEGSLDTHGSGDPKWRELPDAEREKAWHIFVDGSCPVNRAAKDTPAGWGVAIYAPSTDACLQAANVSSSVTSAGVAPSCELFGPVVTDADSPLWLGAEVGSNNTGELSALCEALLWLRDEAPGPRSAPAVIYYDSEYAAGLARGSHRAHKNVGLADTLQRLAAEVLDLRPLVQLIHVKGHSGVGGNELADELAAKGATGKYSPTSQRWCTPAAVVAATATAQNAQQNPQSPVMGCCVAAAKTTLAPRAVTAEDEDGERNIVVGCAVVATVEEAETAVMAKAKTDTASAAFAAASVPGPTDGVVGGLKVDSSQPPPLFDPSVSPGHTHSTEPFAKRKRIRQSQSPRLMPSPFVPTPETSPVLVPAASQATLPTPDESPGPPQRPRLSRQPTVTSPSRLLQSALMESGTSPLPPKRRPFSVGFLDSTKSSPTVTVGSRTDESSDSGACVSGDASGQKGQRILPLSATLSASLVATAAARRASLPTVATSTPPRMRRRRLKRSHTDGDFADNRSPRKILTLDALWASRPAVATALTASASRATPSTAVADAGAANAPTSESTSRQDADDASSAPSAHRSGVPPVRVPSRESSVVLAPVLNPYAAAAAAAAAKAVPVEPGLSCVAAEATTSTTSTTQGVPPLAVPHPPMASSSNPIDGVPCVNSIAPSDTPLVNSAAGIAARTSRGTPTIELAQKRILVGPLAGEALNVDTVSANPEACVQAITALQSFLCEAGLWPDFCRRQASG